MQHARLLLIGAGPAGYSAAIYAARAQLAPVQLAGFKGGGQLMYTSDVENFPGFKDGIRGPQLMMTMREQAVRFGTQIVDAYATALDVSQRPFRVWTNMPADTNPELFETGSTTELAALRAEIMREEPAYTADAVIVTTGASSIMTGVPGEKELLGKGVSVCAVCDSAFYRDKVTFVAGGGDSAMEDALALTKFAKSVTIIHRRDSFKASKIMQERVLKNPKVSVLWNTQVTEVLGKVEVTGLKVTTTTPDGKSDVRELPADGYFLAIGHRPVTQIFDGILDLDPKGYLLTRQSLSAQGMALAQPALSADGLIAYPTMTSVEGVFAAGDNVDFRYRQAITAAGQGCQAALDAEWWLEREAH